MKEIKRIKGMFNNDINCLKFLYTNNQIKTCDSCEGKDFYRVTDFENTFKIICKTCKKKISPTKNTLFDNVRFGLVKAFHIYIEVTLNEKDFSSVEIAFRYNITQKTAWKFLKKIKNTAIKYPIERHIKEKTLDNEAKLLNYISILNKK